tara:strand:- start:76 stop:480 length:405 start_codon:yes stop_codon:yes gene_type:complete
MNNSIKLSIMFGMFGIFTSISINSLAEDQTAESNSKVCVVTLKGKKQTVESEIKKYSCVKGDMLYLTELQLIGASQHTVGMNAARVCEKGGNVQMVALQHMIAASCIFSGKILPIVGHKKTLKLGDLNPPKKKK